MAWKNWAISRIKPLVIQQCKNPHCFIKINSWSATFYWNYNATMLAETVIRESQMVWIRSLRKIYVNMGPTHQVFYFLVATYLQHNELLAKDMFTYNCRNGLFVRTWKRFISIRKGHTSCTCKKVQTAAKVLFLKSFKCNNEIHWLLWQLIINKMQRFWYLFSAVWHRTDWSVLKPDMSCGGSRYLHGIFVFLLVVTGKKSMNKVFKSDTLKARSSNLTDNTAWVTSYLNLTII